MGIIYIPATHEQKDIDNHIVCASDPRIDNHIKFGSFIVNHDLFVNRQIKASKIVNYINREFPVPLRVCWQGGGGINCAKCAKCSRTIIQIILEGGNPINFGFPTWGESLRKSLIFKLKHYIFQRNGEDIEKYYNQIKNKATNSNNFQRMRSNLLFFYKIGIFRNI